MLRKAERPATNDSAVSKMIQMLDGLPDTRKVIRLHCADVLLSYTGIEKGDRNLAAEELFNQVGTHL